MINHAENLGWLIGASLLALCGCEIVQSNIPITFDDGESAAAEAGDPGTPPYTGTACGVASATLCLVSIQPDAGLLDASPDAAADAAPDGSDAAADAAPDGSDAAADAAPDGSDAAADAALPDATAAPAPREWCALHCIKGCDSGAWDCNGPLVCGVGEPPPTCGPAASP